VLCCCDKIPDKNQLIGEEEGFIFAPGFSPLSLDPAVSGHVMRQNIMEEGHSRGTYSFRGN
jgi:hypothetical protein